MHVQVAPGVLQWAVERAGNRAALERKFPKLAEWLAGESQPTFKQLEAFAKAAHVPFGFFPNRLRKNCRSPTCGRLAVETCSGPARTCWTRST